MISRTIPALFCLFLTCLLSAQNQRKCGTQERYLKLINNNPSLLEVRRQAEKMMPDGLRKREDLHTSGEKTILRIPVVFHVIWETNTPAQNITDAQIMTQLEVMNWDYRRGNSDTVFTYSPFRTIAADCEIEFCLAQQDPDGNPTTGITRTQTTVDEIGNKMYYKTSMGGLDNWNPGLYLNIWVCEIDQSGSTFGFAYVPGIVAAEEDGVVIDYRYFGTINTVTSPFHLGRTATHEIGHWLNLEHIWGDANCGDDMVADTPPQQSGTSGCPNPPRISCNNGPNGDMFNNYMDYSDDNCMNLFTQGQKARMWTAINTYRSGLFASKGCDPAISVEENAMSKGNIIVYPNPGQGLFTLNLSSFSNNRVTIAVYSLAGQLLEEHAVENPSVIYNINLSRLGSGMYLLRFSNEDILVTKRVIISR